MIVALNKTGLSGDLLDVVALDRAGVLVTSEGALVRFVEVTPCNPRVMGEEEQHRVGEGFAGLCGRLKAGQSLQFYVEGTPIRLAEVLTGVREDTSRGIGGKPVGRQDALQRLAGAHEESLVQYATEQAAVRVRYYVVVPFLPSQGAVKVDWQCFLPRRRGLPSVGLSRSLEAHYRAIRESLVHTEGVLSRLKALGLGTQLLGGPEVAELLYRRFNPSSVGAGRQSRLEVVGSLDEQGDAQEAAQAARRLRERVAASPLDFKDPRVIEVEQDLERVVYVSSVPDFTEFGWLLGAMEIDRPFALSVHVHALDRRRERQRVKQRFRMLHGVNAGATVRGKVPDLEMEAQEEETQALLDDMRGQGRASVFEVSIYQSVREPGPLADPRSLMEASERAVEAIRDATDANAKVLEFAHREMWQSTLPLGRDVARQTRKYVSRNAGDTVPLVGHSCGSPTGMPFFFTEGSRTLENLNPWDRTFLNGLMVVNGQQGSGKTMFGIVCAARLLAYGVNVNVLDRSGHWELLTRLVPGAVHLSIGSESSDATINPWDVSDLRRVGPEKVAFIRDLHELLIGDHDAGSDQYALSARERALLGDAIRGVYTTCLRENRQPLERDLHAELLRRRGEEWDAAGRQETERSAMLGSLADRLTRYVHDGEDAHLVDRPTTVPTDSPLVVFDTRPARDQLVPAMFIALERIVAQAERRRTERLGQDDQPLFPCDALFSDETWKLLERRATGGYLADVGRRSRHLGLFFAAITQHLSDLNNEHGLALMRSANMRLFFRQSAQELRYLQETLDLSDNEVDLISGLMTAKGAYSEAFWVNGDRGRAKVSLRLGGLEYWMATSEPGQDVPRRAAALARHEDPWDALRELAGQEGLR